MKLRPLGDRVILKYQEAEEKTQPGIILPDSAKEKPQEAMVVAVGNKKAEDTIYQRHYVSEERLTSLLNMKGVVR